MGPADLSVVVPCGNGCERAGETLAALEIATRGLAAEVILADGSTDGSGEKAASRAPARRIEAAAGGGAARLRAEGVAAATGRVVAILQPWTRPAREWARALLDAHERIGRDAVAGGPVAYDGPDRAAAWAQFLFEYGAFLPPLEGRVEELPVNNVSYSRSLLERFEGSWRRGFWKHFLHREMREAGIEFYAEPRALVYHARVVPLPRFLRERADHGRAYAARRGSPAARALLTPLLPPLLTARLAREISRRSGGSRIFFKALLPLLAAECAWAAGEAAGYVAGDGGASERVF